MTSRRGTVLVASVVTVALAACPAPGSAASKKHVVPTASIKGRGPAPGQVVVLQRQVKTKTSAKPHFKVTFTPKLPKGVSGGGGYAPVKGKKRTYLLRIALGRRKGGTRAFAAQDFGFTATVKTVGGVSNNGVTGAGSVSVLNGTLLPGRNSPLCEHAPSHFVLFAGIGDGTFGLPLDVADVAICDNVQHPSQSTLDLFNTLGTPITSTGGGPTTPGGPTPTGPTPTEPTFTFVPLTGVDVGTGPFVVVAGRLNNDAFDDIATSENVGNTASVILGNGAGMFNAFGVQSFGPSGTPRSLAIGDLDGDGLADLFVGVAGQNEVSTFELGADGKPNGSFNSLPTDDSPYSVAAVQLNHDTRSDAVVVTVNGKLEFTESTPDGGYAAPVTAHTNFAGGVRVATGDVNGDNVPDVFVAGSQGVEIFENSGSGVFGNPIDIAAPGATAVAAGDVNGDGRADIVTADTGTNQVEIFPADGAGGWSSTPMTIATSTPTGVLVADVNGDGRNDILTLNRGAGTVSTFLAFGAPGSFTGAHTAPVGTNPLDLTLFNANGDGIPDLAVAAHDDNKVMVLAGKP